MADTLLSSQSDDSSQSLGNAPHAAAEGNPDAVRAAAELAEHADERRGIEQPRTPWRVLDEASQALDRADAIIVLIGCDEDQGEHVSYASEVASDLLGTVKQRLEEAQDLVSGSRLDWSVLLPRSGRTVPVARLVSLQQRIIQLEAAFARSSALEPSSTRAAEACMDAARHALDQAHSLLHSRSQAPRA